MHTRICVSVVEKLQLSNSYEYSAGFMVFTGPQGRETGEERDIYHFWHTAWCDFGERRTQFLNQLSTIPSITLLV